MKPPNGVVLVVGAGGLLWLISFQLPIIGAIAFILVWLGVVSLNFFVKNYSARNVVFRLMGMGFLVVGGRFFATHASGGASPSVSDGFGWTFQLIGAFISVVGFLLLVLRTHRPDLGDAAVGDRTMRVLWGLPRSWARPPVQEQPRKWWTGDPKQP